MSRVHGCTNDSDAHDCMDGDCQLRASPLTGAKLSQAPGEPLPEELLARVKKLESFVASPKDTT